MAMLLLLAVVAVPIDSASTSRPSASSWTSSSLRPPLGGSYGGAGNPLPRSPQRKRRPSPDPARRVTFPCPLCRALGRVSTLVAELDPGPPFLTVMGVRGCEHADGFGQLDRLTLEQEWALIEAALIEATLGGAIADARRRWRWRSRRQ
jgi:hypothetical protein